MINFDLMLIRGNYVIVMKYREYDKLVIIFNHTENPDKKHIFSKKCALENKLMRLTSWFFQLTHMTHLELFPLGFNGGISIKVLIDDTHGIINFITFKQLKISICTTKSSSQKQTPKFHIAVVIKHQRL